MPNQIAGEQGLPVLSLDVLGFREPSSLWPRGAGDRAATGMRLVTQFAIVFFAYLLAGKLGQATTGIRSSNLGPVWPAYGVALAAFVTYGYRIWPAVAGSAFLVAFSSPVPPLAAAGQAFGATLATLTGSLVLDRIVHFHPSISRLRDALGLSAVAFGSALISASIGVFSLYAAGVQAYSGLGSAWLIYWLGDGTGALLVTPLVFAAPSLFGLRSRREVAEFAGLLALLTAAGFFVFADVVFIPIRLHVLAFSVLPFVMWAAISFGIGGASLSVFIIATIATLATAFGSGPFTVNTPFTNAALLDVFFAVLSITGLPLAAVIAERQHADNERERLLREQTAMEARLRLAAIVESSNDAIFATDPQGICVSWNRAATRIFEYTETEIVGRHAAILLPPELHDEEARLLRQLNAGVPVERHRTVRMTKTGVRVNVALTMSAMTDSAGALFGIAMIARDTTERERARNALSGLNRRLIHVQEQERTKIARELHDDISQRIALLAMELSELAAVPSGSVQQGQTVKLQQQASDIAADIQALSHELHSSKIHTLGIEAAMRGFCADFAAQRRVQVDFSTQDVPKPVSSDTSICLLRILQEALHNSAKHSGVTHFMVRLWGAERELHLSVSDRGRGFVLATARTGRGLGLVSMQERVKLLNGDLHIETAPHRGTTVRARVPL